MTNIMHMSNDELFEQSKDKLVENAKKHYENHEKILKKILDDPIKIYTEWSNRLSDVNASFPEFEEVIKYIDCNIKLILNIEKEKDSKNYEMLKLIGHIKLVNITNILYQIKQKYLPYADTIRTIYDALEFFDIYERIDNKNLGPYYHSLNYKYYMTKMLDEPVNCIIFPTISNKIGATDFIKLRHVPIFLCGVSIKSIYVDEYLQSPLEFFVHDINHARRMAEYFKKSITNHDKATMIEESYRFTSEIMSLITINKKDIECVHGIKQLIKMILFEICHEDALYMLPKVVWDACHRDDTYQYVFEKTIIRDNILDVIDYPIYVEGALAYTKFKLQHKFYDDGTKTYVVIPKYRYAKYIAIATIIMLKKLFPKMETKEYSYYLNRTCKNDNIPKPIHSLKIGDDERDIDYTSLKTGLKQNYWKDGHRRFIGEHINDSKNIIDNHIVLPYDTKAHKEDENELIELLKAFGM